MGHARSGRLPARARRRGPRFVDRARDERVPRVRLLRGGAARVRPRARAARSPRHGERVRRRRSAARRARESHRDGARGAEPRHLDLRSLDPRRSQLTPFARANEVVLRVSCVAETFSGGMGRGAREVSKHPLLRGVYDIVPRRRGAATSASAASTAWANDRIDDAERARFAAVAADTLRGSRRSGSSTIRASPSARRVRAGTSPTSTPRLVRVRARGYACARGGRERGPAAARRARHRHLARDTHGAAGFRLTLASRCGLPVRARRGDGEDAAHVQGRFFGQVLGDPGRRQHAHRDVRPERDGRPVEDEALRLTGRCGQGRGEAHRREEEEGLPARGRRREASETTRRAHRHQGRQGTGAATPPGVPDLLRRAAGGQPSPSRA